MHNGHLFSNLSKNSIGGKPGFVGGMRLVSVTTFQSVIIHLWLFSVLAYIQKSMPYICRISRMLLDTDRCSQCTRNPRQAMCMQHLLRMRIVSPVPVLHFRPYCFVFLGLMGVASLSLLLLLALLFSFPLFSAFACSLFQQKTKTNKQTKDKKTKKKKQKIKDL